MESLTQILEENAKYIHSTDGNNNSNNSNTSPSSCQLNCAAEQNEVIRCVDSIRSSSSSSDNDSSSHKDTKPQIQSSCLLEVVSAWTKCCAEANESTLEKQSQTP